MTSKKSTPKIATGGDKPKAKPEPAKKPTPVKKLTPKAEGNVAFDAKAARTALDLNQSEFWSRVFVTQSGGSRYENERSVPKPVQALLVLAYGDLEEAKAMFDHLRSRDKKAT